MNIDEVGLLLRRVLSIYSPSGSEGELADFLLKYMRDRGVDAWINNSGSVIAVKGSGEPALWLHAHMDTVPGPIDVKAEGSVIYGRGAVDDKGTLVSMLVAFLNSNPDITLVLTLVTGEEDDSRGSYSLLKENLPRPGGIIVGEPTNLHIAYAYRGSARIEVRCTGGGGHTAGPGVEENPIVKVYQAYGTLANKLGNRQSAESFTVTPTMVHCGDHPAKVPTECTMVVNVRIPINLSCRDLEGLARDIDCLRVVDCMDPIVVDINNPVVRALVRAELSMGIKPILSRKLGTSDMAIVAKLTRNLAAFGPGDPALSHGPIEYIDVADVVKAADVVKRAAGEYARLVRGS